MASRATSWWILSAVLGWACGPEGITQVVGTETDTETDTAGATTGDTEPTTTEPTDGTPPNTSQADTTGELPSETTTDDCPVGTENCLCDVGSTCDEGLICEDGTCVGRPTCEHPEGERNDEESTAVVVMDLGCGDASVSVDGALDGVDADWFTYHGNAGIACFGGPSAQVTAEADIILCMYFECDQGTTMVQCAPSADPGDSPDGRPGCCGTNSVEVDSVGCGLGNPDDAQVYMRASAADAACLAYQLEYEF